MPHGYPCKSLTVELCVATVAYLDVCCNQVRMTAAKQRHTMPFSAHTRARVQFGFIRFYNTPWPVASPSPQTACSGPGQLQDSEGTASVESMNPPYALWQGDHWSAQMICFLLFINDIDYTQTFSVLNKPFVVNFFPHRLLFE